MIYSKLSFIQSKGKFLLLAFTGTLFLLSQPAFPQYFTHGMEPAQLYGVHEIRLSSTTDTPNPFDTHAEITFYPPPPHPSVQIPLFYDGNHTWRGRAYITTPGRWTWRTHSQDDSKLDNRSGFFNAVDSALPGKLRIHPHNPKAFADERGRTFLNIANTAYYLFSGDPGADTWREFIQEDWDLGIRMLRGLSQGKFAPELFEGDTDLDKLNLAAFQRTDLRLTWMLNTYPGMYVEFILFQFEAEWKEDESFWASLTAAQKDRVLRQYVARYAAFPQILWEIHNDLRYDPGWNNTKAAIEKGTYLKKHDPWGTLITTGAYRDAPFPFPHEPWVSFIHIETLNALTADQVADYAHLPMPVFNGEDRYEAYRGPAHPQYYYRRLMWTWLLSGSSATYGQRWHNRDGATINQPLTPYSQTNYRGLHSVKLIRPFFEDRAIDIALYRDADGLGQDADYRGEANRPQIAAHGNKSFLIYHPNATEAKHGAKSDTEITAGLILDLTSYSGSYRAQWFNAHDGRTAPGGEISSGGKVLLRAPWIGVDVVLRLEQLKITK
ncbi:MAG: hypothetical protein COA73_13305 [Candidatus Hydrogenedentota bacterium]|nr:MAG: hypothetical protein COA73_13305 [Candidatus Hydrogenedentota bacterium]